MTHRRVRIVKYLFQLCVCALDFVVLVEYISYCG